MVFSWGEAVSPVAQFFNIPRPDNNFDQVEPVDDFWFLNRIEINVIADYLGMDVQEFIEKYTRLTSDRKGLSLTERR